MKYSSKGRIHEFNSTVTMRGYENYYTNNGWRNKRLALARLADASIEHDLSVKYNATFRRQVMNFLWDDFYVSPKAEINAPVNYNLWSRK